MQTYSDDILDAADGCPVDVIIVVEAKVDEVEVEEAIVEAEVEVPIAAEAPQVSGDIEGLDSFLSAGDRTLNIFFGSQSGNSEQLASIFAKRAGDYGLEGIVHDMDGFDIKKMASMRRVAIVCSTWGEGEMPDNAEALWQACLLYTSPSPRDATLSRMPSSA